MGGEARALEREGQAGILNIGVVRAKKLRMARDHAGWHQRADRRKIVNLLQCLADDVEANQFAVLQIGAAIAMQRWLDLVEAAAGAGNLDVAGEETTKSISRLRLLGCERLLNVEIGGAQPEIEIAIAAQIGHARRSDGPIEGIELQGFDCELTAVVKRRQCEV